MDTVSEQDPTATTKTVPRRTVAKGAAWTMPVIAIGAAAPAANASSVPQCPPNCLTPIVGAAPATASSVRNNTGTMSIVPAAAPAGFGFIMTCSGIVSGGIATVTGARLTMSDGQTYSASSLALGVAAGALGATAVVFTGAFVFPGVHFPNGTYISAFGIDTSPVKPTQLCVDVDVPINFGIPGQNNVPCAQTICYKPTFVSATAGVVTAGRTIIPIAYATSWVGA